MLGTLPHLSSLLSLGHHSNRRRSRLLQRQNVSSFLNLVPVPILHSSTWSQMSSKAFAGISLEVADSCL